MRATRILLFILLFFLLTSCHSQETAFTYEEPAPLQELGSTRNGITLSLEETTYPASPPSIAATIKNTNNYTMQW